MYLLYKGHIPLLCCAVMPNPLHLSVGCCGCGLQAGGGAGGFLPASVTLKFSLMGYSERRPVCCRPIIIHPPSPLHLPLIVAIAALSAHSDVRGERKSLKRKHTHTRTETPLPNATNPKYFTEACVSSPLARPACGSLRSGRDVMNHPFPEPAAGGERDGVRTAKSQTLPTSTFCFLLTHFYG